MIVSEEFKGQSKKAGDDAMAKNKKKAKRINAKKLLREMQKEAEKTNTGEMTVRIIAPGTISIAQRKRQSMMDKPSNRFAYSMEERVLHDRDCPCVAHIKDDEFNMSESLIFGMPICPHCEKQALIRKAIGTDQKRINAYVGLLKRMNAKKADLRLLIIENKAKFLSVSKDSITVKVRDDEWLLVKGEKENELFHNNYKVLPDFTRESYPGYHQHTFQKTPSFGFLVEQVCQYSWLDHIKKFRERDFQEQIRNTSVNMRSVLMWSTINESKPLTISFSILDYNGYARRCLRKAGVRSKVLNTSCKRDENSDMSCELISIQIYREDIKAFHRAMRAFRFYIINNAYDRYANLCKRYIDQKYTPYKEPTYSFLDRALVWAYSYLHKNKQQCTAGKEKKK